MQLKVSRIPIDEPEILEIRCHKITDNVQEIISFVKSRQGEISAEKDGQQTEIPLIDIFYAESVDNHVFIYTADESYEVRLKLYELEELTRGRSFLRVQKSMMLFVDLCELLVDLGDAIAEIINGEEIIISRKYVPDLKDILKGRELKPIS